MLRQNRMEAHRQAITISTQTNFANGQTYKLPLAGNKTICTGTNRQGTTIQEKQ
jgi:hypothetical protein